MKANYFKSVQIVALVIVCCVFLASCAGKAQEAPSLADAVRELSSEEVYKKIEPATVEIVAEGRDFTSTGTGFYIDENGTVVTNYHVIAKCSSASVNANDGGNYPVEKVLGYSKELDIAILSTNRENCVPVELSTEAVTTGEKVYTLGSSIGLTGTFSEGIVSSADRVLDGMNYIQITTPVSHGNSGGPLVNKKGCVVGIICAGFDDGQNLNLALPISLLSDVSIENPLTIDDFYSASIEGTLKVAVEKDFFPYSFEENGVLYGLHIEIAYYLAEQVGWETEFFPTNYDEMITNVSSGVCDIAFGINSTQVDLNNLGEHPFKQTETYYRDMAAVVYKGNGHSEKIITAYSHLLSDGTIDALIHDYQTYIDHRISRVGARTVSFQNEWAAEALLLSWKQDGYSEQALIKLMDELGSKQGGGKLYTVQRGDWVDEIDQWLFAYNRRVGDFEIIKNPLGYSVVYVSSIE